MISVVLSDSVVLSWDWISEWNWTQWGLGSWDHGALKCIAYSFSFLLPNGMWKVCPRCRILQCLLGLAVPLLLMTRWAVIEKYVSSVRLTFTIQCMVVRELFFSCLLLSSSTSVSVPLVAIGRRAVAAKRNVYILFLGEDSRNYLCIVRQVRSRWGCWRSLLMLGVWGGG